MSTQFSILSANSIELHYRFNDNSHTMNAAVFNKCECEFLGIAKELAVKLNVEMEIEVEPLANGGLRSWFSFNSKDKSTIKTAFFVFLLTNVLFTPIMTTIDVITRKVIDSFFEDPEISELKKEKEKAELKYDIAKFESETKPLCRTIDENIIKKKKSNYYESLSKYEKVEDVSIAIEDDKKNIIKESKIHRENFEQYILSSNELDPEIEENAIIEIVSPVLKKGKYKWVGIYNGKVIQFSMKSNEFKTLVQTGKIQFKNGSSIICNLIITKQLDNDGVVKIKGYNVTSVDVHFENSTPIETPEGRLRRQKKEAEKKQLSFDL